ncbi:ERF family protein [Variovorax sp. PMC12]|uniref:ERF family protein n=1 Tax=Variovorax sp. PMC12 TaxID=2126319 RepID=UPI00131A924C|nr:ERF family protein [Variovorax sp. PMC12]
MNTATEERTIDMLDAAPTTHSAPALTSRRDIAAAPASAGPMGNALAFLQAGGTIDQMRDILALQREWEAGEAKKAYVAAMAQFKKNPPKILKDKRVYFESKNGGTATDYWHATLGNVAEAIIEGLAEVGVSHSWKPERIGDRVHVTCTLTHAQGHSESISLDGPLDSSGTKNNIQQVASTTTYLSRYTLLMITGLAVKDEILPDNDGGPGGAGGGAPFDTDDHGDRKAATYDHAMFTANLAQWKAVISDGRKTPDALIDFIEKRNLPLTDEQKKTLRAVRAA